jgi:hypothetical protein
MAKTNQVERWRGGGSWQPSVMDYVRDHVAHLVAVDSLAQVRAVDA